MTVNLLDDLWQLFHIHIRLMCASVCCMCLLSPPLVQVKKKESKMKERTQFITQCTIGPSTTTTRTTIIFDVGRPSTHTHDSPNTMDRVEVDHAALQMVDQFDAKNSVEIYWRNGNNWTTQRATNAAAAYTHTHHRLRAKRKLVVLKGTIRSFDRSFLLSWNKCIVCVRAYAKWTTTTSQ